MLPEIGQKQTFIHVRFGSIVVNKVFFRPLIIACRRNNRRLIAVAPVICVSIIKGSALQQFAGIVDGEYLKRGIVALVAAHSAS